VAVRVRGQTQLLGAVLGNQDKTAIRHGLGDDAHMGAVAQGPGFLLGLGCGEPTGLLAPPGGKVACFRDPARVMCHVEQPLERQRVQQRARAERKEPLKRLIGKGQLTLGIELRDTRGQLVEHRALRLAERPERPALLFHVLDIDGIARDALLPERQVADAQRAPLTADGRLHYPLDR
jgi:hypothetical protein